MRLFRSLSLVLVLLVGFSQMAHAGDADREYRQAKTSYQKLLNSSKKQLYRENWVRVRDLFLAVKEGYPTHSRAADSLYMAGKTSEGLYRISLVANDARDAVAYYDALVDQYPASSLADDALVLAGSVEEEILGEYGQAYLRFARVLERYPNGDMAGKARLKVKDLASFAPRKLLSEGGTPSSTATGSGPGELTGIRFWSNPGYTRIVIDMNAPAQFVSNLLRPKGDFGPRLYVDIINTQPSAGLTETIDVNDGLLRQIRTGRPAEGTVRVVLDLLSLKDFKIFPLEDPYRIVIDVEADRKAEITAIKPEVSTLPSSGKDGIAGILEKTPGDQPLKVQIPQTAPGNALRRIVIDAGHGGKDPGAIGPSGILEKDVVLNLAKALRARLQKDLGCEVLLTRDDDTYLPLEERTAIANKVNADLFISLHANASPSGRAYGIETYYLNFSKNEKAAALAARENGTSLKEVGDLELILLDLMVNSKINESSRLAAEIQNSLVDGLSKSYSRIKDLGVRQGPFYVLLGATMPSVLVETAFISNKMEESRLSSDKYRDKTVAAISEGVRNYANALKMIASK